MITIECTTEELELLLHAATDEGSCLMILKASDDTPIYLRVRGRERRPRKTAGAGRSPQPHSGEQPAA